MVGYEPPDLEALVRLVIEDARAAVRREEDRALNESRRVVMEAEDRIADLSGAARDLGRVRGEAADVAQAREADREIRVVEARAFDALWDRFRMRLRMRLDALPTTPGYPAAVGHWAREAAAAMTAPAEVFTAARDRAVVYEALLAAGASDFHVRVDHGVQVGFVVRDLDGRTLVDRRPEALLEAHEADLRALLEQRVPPFARPPADADLEAPAVLPSQAGPPGAGGGS
jgi:vacuolar-type H+-ATPase subunit E/Vma4